MHHSFHKYNWPKSMAVSLNGQALISKSLKLKQTREVRFGVRYFFPPQRFKAPFRAISRRCSGVNLAARALPPLRPPKRPKATAAGFFLVGFVAMLSRLYRKTPLVPILAGSPNLKKA
jgi:hypothetical protein